MYMRKTKRRNRKYGEATKRKVIELYEQGYGCVIISRQLNVCDRSVLEWINSYRHLGDKWLEKKLYTKSTPEFKQYIVRHVLEKGLSCEQVALQNGVSISSVKSWRQKVKDNGYDSLFIINPKERPPKFMGRPRKKKPQTELEILREQNERLRTEVALLKKVKALVEQRDAQLKEFGRKPSKS